VTPNQVAWLEEGLAALGPTGLPEAEKLSVILLVSGYVRNEATTAADVAAAAGGAEIMPAYAAALGQVVDPARFPALHAALQSEAFARDDDPDEEFVFGLERVLDGVEALVQTRASSRRTR
jgi:Tetracyclin repressor-like, C-terminal domain